jgi:hypothetical protein
MIERVALLLYWRIPRYGRKIVRGYVHDQRGLVDIQLPRGWGLTRWRRAHWKLERPQRLRETA